MVALFPFSKLESALVCLLAALGLSIVGWWALLLYEPEYIFYFHPDRWEKTQFFTFLPADILIVVGAWGASYGIAFRRDWARSAVWATAAMSFYPTIYCIGVSVVTGECWIASALMGCLSGALLACGSVVGVHGQDAAAFRDVDLSAQLSVVYTLGQIVLFWGLFLWLLPMGIAELESHWGVSDLSSKWISPLVGWLSVFACVTFVAGSTLGLSSGLAMAVCGKGTPLPTASASDLVVRGPYRWIRNPMAVAGVTQGIAVGLWLTSPTVVLGSLIAGMFWRVAIRPFEEADLIKRHGRTYLKYRQTTPLWLPTARSVSGSARSTSVAPRHEYSSADS